MQRKLTVDGEDMDERDMRGVVAVYTFIARGSLPHKAHAHYGIRHESWRKRCSRPYLSFPSFGERGYEISTRLVGISKMSKGRCCSVEPRALG